MKVKIRSLSIGLLIGALCMTSCTVVWLFFVARSFLKMSQDVENYVRLQDDVRRIGKASDFLTDSARQFVVTKNIRFMKGYFDEVNERKNRENSLGDIMECVGSELEDSVVLLAAALGNSNDLIIYEVHAMKLAAISAGIPESEYPAEVAAFVIPAEEVSLPEKEKLALAYKLVFDEHYANEKERIMSRLEMAMMRILDRYKRLHDASWRDFRDSLLKQGAFVAIMLALVLSAFILIEKLILRPIMVFMKCIREQTEIELAGAVEFRYLAAVYNRMFLSNNAAKAKLKFEAEHDSLTGILNRGAFESLVKEHCGSGKIVGLLLIDVDKFKKINDMHGHEMGDAALKRLADMMTRYFRDGDYPVRYGGDEFAVLLTEIPDSPDGIGSAIKTVREKIDDINAELLVASADCPVPFSVSVGAAFSKNGAGGRLFNNADIALYKMKSAGRCGVMFSDEIL